MAGGDVGGLRFEPRTPWAKAVPPYSHRALPARGGDVIAESEHLLPLSCEETLCRRKQEGQGEKRVDFLPSQPEQRNG